MWVEAWPADVAVITETGNPQRKCKKSRSDVVVIRTRTSVFQRSFPAGVLLLPHTYEPEVTCAIIKKKFGHVTSCDFTLIAACSRRH